MRNFRRRWIIDANENGFENRNSHDFNNAMVSTNGRKSDQNKARPERLLTEREMTILALLAHGKRNREISEELAITERTVKFHVSGLFSKLGASNRTEAVRLGVQRGLVRL